MKLIPDVKYETVSNILQGKAFEGKVLWLPTVQRDFVWNERKIADFLDSLYKGYPVGVITLIKTKHDFPKLPVEDRNDDNSSEEKFYVIDGQQRITSLLLMKNNGGEEKWELSRSRKIISRNYIGYNPEEAEIKFITRRGTNVANVLKKAIDYQEIKDDKGKEMAKRILDYKIPMSIINLEFESDEDTDKIYEDIADMFIRVNSSGVRIGSIEMFLSFFSGAFDKNDIKAKINEIHVRLDKNYSIDLEPILRFIFWRLGITQNDFKPKKFRGAIIKLKEKLKVERKDIIGELNKCEQVIENTFKFFSEELGLNKSVVERFLPSQNIMVPIFAFAYTSDGHIPKKYKDEVISWFIISSFYSIYSQSTNSKIQNDLELFSEGKKEFPFDALTKGKKKSKSIKKEDITGYYENIEDFSRGERKASKNYQFLIYTLLHLNGATDFEGNLIKDNKNIDIHHIFPKKVIDDDDLVNDFSNITFISEKSNRVISDSLPEEYLVGYKNKELEKHFIPTERELYKKEKCEDFLNKRAVLIWEAVKKYINDTVKG
mgnify:CR=1 FL=1